VVALFTSGGAISMRGYGSQRLSPMVLQDGKWIPTGGNGLLEGSLEVRKELDGNLGLVVFMDAGNVSDASGSPSEYRSAFDLTRLQLALGAGLRYRTPFGPFRVDGALRLPTDYGAGVPFNERFPAVPGSSGHREPIATLHITLGEAF
jgi:translocation and assembly module TamA